ncbi:hypothetical protein SAMN05216503_1702 [Polaribacter sp. KT25b]|uniref:hypothetical protein n=1 Tax=Polaribacter sp. KT25b TaxID=1855336 RepID=UPI00087CB521|nr:hypothetical protein [Polaribacter sp. KT25b]SDS01567.1 hypothetical protein SAMN05216503_1702 [Polaribacter sp. KT25b]
MKEEKNKTNRKLTPLTFKEKISFFLFPFGYGSDLFPIKDINDSELERFKKYGFDKKIEDAIVAKKLGIIFYLLIPLILLLSTS